MFLDVHSQSFNIYMLKPLHMKNYVIQVQRPSMQLLAAPSLSNTFIHCHT